MKITGRVESYEINNLTLKGRSKPYYISPNDIKAAMVNFPPGMIVTLTIEKGTVKGMAEATAAEATSYLQDEKATEAMKAAQPRQEPPFKTGKEILQQNLDEKLAAVAHADAACAQISKEEKGPAKETPPAPAKGAPETPDADQIIRASIKIMPPSDRVGFRISLAGMVNSVIEMEKMCSDAPKTYAELEADVKQKALSLFLWCDNMTTQNIR